VPQVKFTAHIFAPQQPLKSKDCELTNAIDKINNNPANNANQPLFITPIIIADVFKVCDCSDDDPS